MVSRPAVSMITTSRPIRFACSMPWRAMSTVGVPDRGAIDGDVEAVAERLELVGGGGPVRVRGDEQRLAAQLDDVLRELGGGRRLARALEADERDDGRAADEAERPVARRQERGELLVDDLHDLLAGGQALEDLGADRTLAHAGDEVLDDLEVDVGLEQGEADLAHRGVDVGLGHAAATGQPGKGLRRRSLRVSNMRRRDPDREWWGRPRGKPGGWCAGSGDTEAVGSVRPPLRCRPRRPWRKARRPSEGRRRRARPATLGR